MKHDFTALSIGEFSALPEDPKQGFLGDGLRERKGSEKEWEGRVVQFQIALPSRDPLHPMLTFFF